MSTNRLITSLTRLPTHTSPITTMSTRIPRTRSQSGIRQIRKATTELSEPPKERHGPLKKKKKSHPLDRNNSDKTAVLLKKPRYFHKKTVVKYEVDQNELPRKKTKQEVLEKLEVCAKLITPTLQLVSPALKEQVDQLFKFKMFKSFDLDLGTLNLLQSTTYQMDEDDEKLMKIMEMENGKQQQEAMFKHYGLKSTPGKEEFNNLFMKREEPIEEFSLNG